MNSSTRAFNKITLVLATICGVILSLFIGIGTYRQACPNFDSKDTICATKALLNSTGTGPIAEAKAIGQNLSAYNRKVANSRLLTHYNGQDFSKLTDPQLLTLKDHYKETAVKPFAVREYGILTAVGVGIFSVGLTVTTVWLLIWVMAVVFTKRKSVWTYTQESV